MKLLMFDKKNNKRSYNSYNINIINDYPAEQL